MGPPLRHTRMRCCYRLRLHTTLATMSIYYAFALTGKSMILLGRTVHRSSRGERSQCWARLGSSMLGAKVGETERSVGVGERLIEFCGFWLGFRGTSGMRAERPWTSLLRTVPIRSRGLLFWLSVIFMGFSLKTWCSASSRGSGWAVPLKSSGLDRGPIEELWLRQREAGAHMLGGSGSLPHLVHGLVFAGRASDPCH